MKTIERFVEVRSDMDAITGTVTIPLDAALVKDPDQLGRAANRLCASLYDLLMDEIARVRM